MTRRSPPEQPAFIRIVEPDPLFAGARGYVVTKTPFHQAFVERARELRGRWNSRDRTWTFDLEHREAVELLCRQCYRDVRLEMVTAPTAGLVDALVPPPVKERAHMAERAAERLRREQAFLDGLFDDEAPE